MPVVGRLFNAADELVLFDNVIEPELVPEKLKVPFALALKLVLVSTAVFKTVLPVLFSRELIELFKLVLPVRFLMPLI